MAHRDRTLGNITKMPCTCLTAEVASIRVNCQIYVTSVMIIHLLRFYSNRVHYQMLFFLLFVDSSLPMCAYYIGMLWCQMKVMYSWYSCDADIFF